jgi:chromate transport protein ChrA
MPNETPPPREELLYDLERMRLQYTFGITIAGLGIAVGVALVMLFVSSITAEGIAAVVGLFTSVLGTIVGAFLGLQIGLGGKAEADNGRIRALAVAMEAIEVVKRTNPEEAAKLYAKLP